jgi:tRNA-2-methylthio-N6-dimethylallyladenosine synthase
LDNKKKLYINTFGCQMNVYDSEQMAKILKPLGYEMYASIEAADLVVVNTCAIRKKAEQKVFSFLGRLASLKRKRPDLIICVGGCVAQQEGRMILERVPFVDLVFGTHAINRLPEHIRNILLKRCRIADVEMTQEVLEFHQGSEPAAGNNVTRFVTIMRGCGQLLHLLRGALCKGA